MTRPKGTGAQISSGERSLWAAVLNNAIVEAEGIVPDASSNMAKRNAIARARDYLTVPNADFNTVCTLAGLDPQAVRERMRRRFPPTHAPGVGDDFPDLKGTGGRSVAQDLTELEISK